MRAGTRKNISLQRSVLSWFQCWDISHLVPVLNMAAKLRVETSARRYFSDRPRQISPTVLEIRNIEQLIPQQIKNLNKKRTCYTKQSNERFIHQYCSQSVSTYENQQGTAFAVGGWKLSLYSGGDRY